MKRGFFIGQEKDPGNKTPAQLQEERAAWPQLDGIHAPAAVDGANVTACGMSYTGFKTNETMLAVNCAGCRAVIKFYKQFRT